MPQPSLTGRVARSAYTSLAARHRDAQNALKAELSRRLRQTLDTLPLDFTEDRNPVAEYQRVALPLVRSAQYASVGLAAGFVSTSAQLAGLSLGRPNAGMGQAPDLAAAYDSIAVADDAPAVIAPALRLLRDTAEGSATAREDAGSYAASLAGAGVNSAMRAGADAAGDESPEEPVGWVKDLNPTACDWCVLVGAERVYLSAESIPQHGVGGACQCGVAPAFAGETYRHPVKGYLMQGEPLTPISEWDPLPAGPTEIEREARDAAIRSVPLAYFDKLPARARADAFASMSRTFENVRPEVIRELRGVLVQGRNDSAFMRRNPTALAFYRDASKSIHIRPGQYRNVGARLDDMLRMTSAENNWWTPDGAGEISAADRTLTHELGHFLDYSLSPEQRYEMLSHLQADHGILTNHEAGAFVSAYAGTNDKELVAELWSEYKTAPNPRPPAAYAGRYIEDKLGTNPTPTPSIDETRAWKVGELHAWQGPGQ